MIIAVTAQGKTPESLVEQRFGRTNGFVLFNTNTREYSFLGNSMNANATQGAGIQTAQYVANNNVNIVITGNCGPKAFSALKAAGIQLSLGATGTVQDCIQQWENGSIQYAAAPNVMGRSV